MKKAKLHQFIRIRRAGVPIGVFESFDPAATVEDCSRSLNGQRDETPLFVWDCAGSLRPARDAVTGAESAPAKAWLAMQPDEVKASFGSPMFAQSLIEHPPIYNDKPGVVFALNMHAFIAGANGADPGTVQALWNLRDPFKANGCTLILVGCNSKLPPELKNDAPIFEEEIPDEETIGAVIDSTLKDAEIDASRIDRPKVIDGLLGYLSRFGVEQALALSLDSNGVDFDQLWDLKVAALKNAAGLEVTRPTLDFSGMAGNEGMKHLLKLHLNGREKPRAILQLDELEKAAAGSTGGDLSGTSQALMEQFLYWTQAKRVKGFLLVGVPGAGKSLTCEVAAAEANCPLLRASFSTVKGSLVGQSEQQMKTLLASVDAIAQGRVLMLATCNSFESLSPELMARFTLGTVMFDYPTDEEAKSIGAYYTKKYKIKEPWQHKPKWVGREIESCCERAWLWNIPLDEASKSVVPVCMSNAGKMDALRRSANGRFLSAAYPGVFSTETEQSTGRKMQIKA